tara:strand:- start:678 stop:3146 length:2469 start_codon:yes stop_codon:yes gene_type:complete
MGWLGLAGGYAAAGSQRMETEREQLWAEEQNLINTMLPLAIENRKQRQVDRKKYKEQYSVLTSIVSPDIAQSIMRKGDLFTQDFMTKVGDMENEMGRAVTEADLIESGDVARQMEHFPMGMRTVETAKRTGPLGGGEVQTERVRAASVSTDRYRELGADFDTFMSEMLGDFKNTDIDTNKLKEDIILNFGQIPGYEKALTNSAYRKIAAQMGISPNEVTSLATGEYDYTDVPMSRDEMYRRDVRIPFVKGKAFYDSQNAKISLEQVQRANNRKVSVTINGVKETVTMAEAIEILGYEKAILAYEREAAQRVTSKNQDTALTPINISRSTKSAGEWVADTLGGTHHTDVNGVVTYSFGNDDASARKRELAYRVTQDLNMIYTETVLDNTVGTFVEYQNLAGLDDPQKLRMFMLNAAYNMDPDTNTYVKLLTENFIPPKESQFYQGETGWGTIPDRPAFARALEIINNEQGGFKPQTRVTPKVTSEVISEDTWGNLSYEKFVTFTKKYKLEDIGDQKNRAVIATEFSDTLFDDIKQFKGITESTYDDSIREYLDMSNILANKKLSLYSIKEGGESKFSKIEAKVDGLEEFIDGLMPETDETLIVDTDTAAAATRKAEEEATRKAEAEAGARRKVIADQPTIIDPVSKTTGRWSGELKDGNPVGVGTMTLEDDGKTMSGEYDQNGEEVGPWVITDLKTGDEETRNFSMTEDALDNIDQKYEEIDRFIGFTIRPFRDSDKHKGVKETIVNLGAELRDSYDEYKIGRLSTEDFTNKMKELGLAVDKAVEEVWVDDIYNKFKLASLGGGLHKEYLGDLAKFKKEFNIN